MPPVLWITFSAVLGCVAGITVTALAAHEIITRRLAATREAEKRALAAERLADAGAMTGGLAHEIKNPLSTIGLNAQLIREGVEDLPIPGDHKGRLLRRTDALAREVERLGGILEDFLDYAGGLHIEPRSFDLRTLVEELADFFAPQADVNGVRLRVDLPAVPVPTYADAAQIKQAALNLMLNAVQAMSQGRSGESESGPARELILRAAATRSGHGTPVATLHVIDTGPGMDAQTRDRVFQPYFTTKAGGSGLGLPTAKRIVEAHGGTLRVHSEPGKGTDIAIELPASA